MTNFGIFRLFDILAPKIGKFGIIRSLDIPRCSQFYFLYSPFDINQSSQFLFPILVTRKFERSTFELSLILKFETSATQNFIPHPI